MRPVTLFDVIVVVSDVMAIDCADFWKLKWHTRKYACCLLHRHDVSHKDIRDLLQLESHSTVVENVQKFNGQGKTQRMYERLQMELSKKSRPG